MSTQPATQSVPVSTQESSAQAATTGTPAVSASAKKQKITDTIVSTLRKLEEGQTMTISELSAHMGGVKRETLQATLSQMVKAKRVEKVTTGKRQPGYKAAK